jgi:hypothetical protein
MSANDPRQELPLTWYQEEAGTQIARGAAERIRRTRRIAAEITSGEFQPPHPPPSNLTVPQAAPTPASGVALNLNGTSLATAAPEIGAPRLLEAVSMVPTDYSADVSGTVVINNNNTYVTINFNGAPGGEFLAKFDELLEQLKQSNKPSPEAKAQLTAEMKAGVEYAKAPKASRAVIDLLLVHPLKTLAEKFEGALIGKLAAQLLELLQHLISTLFT